ncbi:MAG: hypothetical protein KGD64_09570 [Candidatus Heimdallarchaeota archaeon]|nr:hypothetical protein [Candidatus Heimdallarchaeota archaeon]
MKRYNPDERIQTYLPIQKFSSLLSKETENQVEEGKFEEYILESPSSRNQKEINSAINDPIERLLVLSLTAKNMSDSRKTDDRNILFSLSRVPYFLFPNFHENNVNLYSQADLEEILSFIDKFSKNLPQYSPRSDNQMMVTLKIEYYVNAFLYFAKSMTEKRFPYGSDYYDFLSFMFHEFFSILKPIKKDAELEVKNLINLLNDFLTYTTIIYFVEHYPEQVMEISFLLQNMKKTSLSKSEKELLVEFLEETILIDNEDKKLLLEKLKINSIP